jgi:hypothetical protein
MARNRDQSTYLTRDGARAPAAGSAYVDVRGHLTAFDDEELSNWLMECIEGASENFLCAVAEAALAANAEDYLVIRPALLALRRKHSTKRAIKAGWGG